MAYLQNVDISRVSRHDTPGPLSDTALLSRSLAPSLRFRLPNQNRAIGRVNSLHRLRYGYNVGKAIWGRGGWLPISPDRPNDRRSRDAPCAASDGPGSRGISAGGAAVAAASLCTQSK